MPNSGHGGPPGTRVMTIFVFYVSAQIPNIEYFEVYGGLQALGGISSSVSLIFPSNAVRIMSGDRFLSRVLTILIKTHFYKLRRTHRRAVVVAVAVAAVVVAVVAAVAVVTTAVPPPPQPPPEPPPHACVCV